MKRIVYAAVLAVVVAAASAPAGAQEMVTVRLTNVSQQIISPPVVATHTWRVRIFIPGNAASDALALMAEDGDPSEIAALLADSEDVMDFAVADGPLLPGETMVFQLASADPFDRISAVGMLVTTNDAFFGLDNFVVQRNLQNQRVWAPAWDAGTEYNNELCAFIPGPPCGNPFVRDTTDAEGFISTHSGLQGVGDVSLGDWNWQNPVVDILVIKQ